MKIGYRRFAGGIALSANESLVRSHWTEKRRNFIAGLIGRGHEVTMMSGPTRGSRGLFEYDETAKVDVLIIEQGMQDYYFGAKDLTKTLAIIERHEGRVVYVCDDPDLFPKPDLHIDYSNWLFAVNCLYPERIELPAPAVDFPMMPIKLFYEPPRNVEATASYVGRPNGRGRQVKSFLATGLLEIYGAAKDWKAYDVQIHPAPKGHERYVVMRRHAYSLSLFDSKHAKYGWRTGRAYHSLNAGVPVVVSSGNDALSWAEVIEPQDLSHFVSQPPATRHEILNKQRLSAWQSPSWEAIGL